MYASLGRTGWSFSLGGTKSALYKSVDSGKHGTKSTLVFLLVNWAE
jgi:hypothetical protein